MVGRTRPFSPPLQPANDQQAGPAPAIPLWVVLSNQAGELEREPATDSLHALLVAMRMLALMLEFGDGYSIKCEKGSKNLVPLR
jgi:hypothetical protein